VFRDPAGIEQLRLHAINMHMSATMTMESAERISNAVENYRTTLYQLMHTHDVLDKEAKLAMMNRKMDALVDRMAKIVDDIYNLADELNG
jgi:hypothetical protein